MNSVARIEPSGCMELGDALPLVPEGEYTLKYVRYRTAIYSKFGKVGKVILTFSVIDFGEHFGTELARWYNAELKGKPRPNGKFRIGRCSDAFRELAQVIPQRISRTDRIPLSALENLQIRARVETVRRDYKQRTLAKPAQYSKVAELLGVVK